MYKDIIRKGYARDETLYKTKGKPFIPFEKNEALQQYISAIAEQTAETMKNISQSLGFAVKSGDKRAFKPIANIIKLRSTMQLTALLRAFLIIIRLLNRQCQK